MKKTNGMTVYEENDECALDEYSAAIAEEVPKLIKESKYDDTLIKNQIETLKQKEKEDVSKLQQQQEKQDSNITSNTTEIEKLKVENEILRSQIPTRTSKWNRDKANRCK